MKPWWSSERYLNLGVFTNILAIYEVKLSQNAEGKSVFNFHLQPDWGADYDRVKQLNT